MACGTVKLPGGAFAIVCGLPKPKPCIYCGRPHTKLCDFPLEAQKKGKTCDRPMCDRCTTHIDPDTDYCGPHARIMKAREKEQFRLR